MGGDELAQTVDFPGGLERPLQGTSPPCLLKVVDWAPSYDGMVVPALQSSADIALEAELLPEGYCSQEVGKGWGSWV